MDISVEHTEEISITEPKICDKYNKSVNVNDDFQFVMITHALCVAIAISSGHQSNHYVVGKI